ncbi:hypothetical protein ACOMHN_005596 [Nucella lapillus]
MEVVTSVEGMGAVEVVMSVDGETSVEEVTVVEVVTAGDGVTSVEGVLAVEVVTAVEVMTLCHPNHRQVNPSQVPPCHWETQPGGCTKPYCAFRHSRRRVFGSALPMAAENRVWKRSGAAESKEAGIGQS